MENCYKNRASIEKKDNKGFTLIIYVIRSEDINLFDIFLNKYY